MQFCCQLWEQNKKFTPKWKEKNYSNDWKATNIHKTKQSVMKRLLRVFCGCCTVGNNHRRGYPFHHDREAAMIKSTCMHHTVSTCHVWPSSSVDHRRVTVHSTVGNSHRGGYPSHHNSVQWQAKYDHLAVPMISRPSEQTEHRLNTDWTQTRTNTDEHTLRSIGKN